MRITKVDEYQFLSCLKYSLWGSKTARFSNWCEGDYLVICVNKAIAGYAQVSGKPFKSDTIVWDDGLFPYRIPIKFIHILALPDRIPILGKIRELLVTEWGSKYGWGILNQQIVSETAAKEIINIVSTAPNSLSNIQSSLEEYLREADQQRRNNDMPKLAQPTSTTQITQQSNSQTPNERQPVDEESIHSKAQSALIQLGIITGCSVWVASNDRNRLYNGKTLGENCLRELPNLGLPDEVTRAISLIDIIWFKQKTPICAFEVEATTSIYSGILRMSDLVSEISTLRIKLFIVAPKERQEKVKEQLTRPTFRKTGLNDFCKFLSIEAVVDLLTKIQEFGGHIQPSIIDKIAIEYGEEIG